MWQALRAGLTSGVGSHLKEETAIRMQSVLRQIQKTFLFKKTLRSDSFKMR